MAAANAHAGIEEFALFTIPSDAEAGIEEFALFTPIFAQAGIEEFALTFSYALRLAAVWDDAWIAADWVW